MKSIPKSMGAPLPPNAIMPPEWAAKAELRELTGHPTTESETAYWIEEIFAWVAIDEDEVAAIHEAEGAGAKVILIEDLP